MTKEEAKKVVLARAEAILQESIGHGTLRCFSEALRKDGFIANIKVDIEILDNVPADTTVKVAADQNFQGI